MRLPFCVGVCLVLAGCAPYASFVLPAAAGTAQPAVQWKWTAEEKPQITRGEEGSVDVLNPAVVKTDAGYVNFYSAFDGETWHTALASSPDGRRWKKAGRVFSPDAATWEAGYIAANGSVRRVGQEYWHWYQAGPEGRTRIGLARSADGRKWAREKAPVLEPGPRGAWDEVSLGDPDVVVIDGTFYMYYLGQDRARRQRLGVARSRDGVRWEKLLKNPVLAVGAPHAFDENGLGEPAVWAMRGEYWMLYTGRDRQELRRMGLARSRDGVTWTKVAQPVIAGLSWWNDKVVCDASVAVRGEGVDVWFGGGTVAHPAERINGSIGFGRLELK